MRVFVVEGSGKGGMIHYDYHLCRALQRDGVDTTLVTSTAYELRDLEHNFRVVELLRLWDPRGSKTRNRIVRAGRRGLRAFQYIVEWLRLVQFLRKERPEIVLFGEIRFGFELIFLRMLKASGLTLAAIVHDVRNYDTRPDSKAVTRDSEDHIALYNKIYSQFSALFVHDRTNYDLFLKLYHVPVERVYQIPLATNEIVLEVKPDRTPEQLRKELSIQPEQPVILFFGAISRYKGVDNLVRAFPEVHKATGARLVIAGFPAKDVDPDGLKQLAAELGVADHITWFLDYVPNERVVPLMSISHVVAFPYKMISQSAALQVAYACGRPVVVTRVGGLPDVVEHGKSGLVVPPDNPEALGAALKQIILDPAAQEMGRYAKILAETRFSWRVVAHRMKTVFEQSSAEPVAALAQSQHGANR